MGCVWARSLQSSAFLILIPCRGGVSPLHPTLTPNRKPNYNPADYIMTTATVPSMEALKKAGFFEHQKAKPSSSGNLQALSPSSGKARKVMAVG